MKLLRFFGGLLRGRFLRPEPAVVSPQSQSTLKLFIGHRPVSTAGRSVHIPCMTAADAAYLFFNFCSQGMQLVFRMLHHDTR